MTGDANQNNDLGNSFRIRNEARHANDASATRGEKEKKSSVRNVDLTQFEVFGVTRNVNSDV